jgi:heme/copper-type cytochrome/quinol oxidase subunit 2
MEIVQRRPVIGIVAFILGFAIGLFVFGWWLTPVQYTGAGPQDLLPEYQEIYIRTVSDLYSQDLNQENVRAAFAIWPEADQTICLLAEQETDPAAKDRLTTTALILNNEGCTEAVLAEAAAAAEEGGGNNTLLIICLVLGVIIAALALIYLFINRGRDDEGEETSPPPPMPAEKIIPSEDPAAEDVVATPLARFDTQYVSGHDSYDDSFSIENAQGDFLGECGVGISDTVPGGDETKNVTAFEIWLFDKNDIRTVTKVVMSEHAFNDEGIKAKLAPKGEPVLARENETIVLETATLIINAEILSMEYDQLTMPAEGIFNNFSVEISAWAKDGDFDEPDVQGHIDQMLDY